MAYSSIINPSAYFQTTLYTGTGSDQNITNTGNSDLQPDWTWIKKRNGSTNNMVTDSVRGATKNLVTNTSAVEDTDANGLKAFLSDGFTVGSTGAFNSSNDTFVSWNWKAGTSFSNSAGANGASIASTGSINTAAGFSIISYTGSGSNATIAHGLGVAPKMIIFKNRQGTNSWRVAHDSIGWNKSLFLDNANAAQTEAYFQNTAPTSQVFYIGTDGGTNGNNNNIIAYCFAEKQGYSKFSSYEGNGNVNGTFIYTGFKPAFVMVKPVDASDNWVMFDNKRDTFNSSTSPFNLYANTNGVETTDTGQLDFTAQGFKIRNGGNTVNRTSTFIYMSFAEEPFVASNYNAATAR